MNTLDLDRTNGFALPGKLRAPEFVGDRRESHVKGILRHYLERVQPGDKQAVLQAAQLFHGHATGLVLACQLEQREAWPASVL